MATLTTPWQHLEEISPQLSVSWYLDPEILAAERETILDCGPGYVGHELLVPEVGTFHTLNWTDDAWMLVHTPTGVEFMSNVCRHRQAIILEGRGKTRNIVCPLHRWSYTIE